MDASELEERERGVLYIDLVFTGVEISDCCSASQIQIMGRLETSKGAH